MMQSTRYMTAVSFMACALFWGGLAGEAAAEYRTGDRIVITASETRLMSGKNLVATVPAGRECEVERVSGNWLLTRLVIDGKLRRGWLQHKHVSLISPTSKSPSKPRPTKPRPQPKAATPGTRPQTKPGQKAPPILQRHHTLRGHRDDVYCLAFSADGKTLASGGGDQTIGVWDVATGKRIAELKGHKQRVRCLRFSPVMDIVLASGGGQISGGELKLWNLKEKKLIADLPVGDSEVVSLDFSPDGMTLFTAGWSRFISMWDVIAARRRGKIRASLTEMVRHVAVAPDGKYIANHGQGGIVFLRALEKALTGTKRPTEGVERILSEHKKNITSLKFSRNGQLLAAGSEDRVVLVWNTAAGNVVARFQGHEGTVSCVDFSPDGNLLASGSLDVRKPLKVWDLSHGRLVAAMESEPVFAVVFSPQGNLLASADGADIQLWSVHFSPSR